MCLMPNCQCVPRVPEYTSEKINKAKDHDEEKENIEEDDDEEEEEYEVEKIVAKRFKKGRPEYKVKWKNWPESTNTWEPVHNLNCHDLLDDYENNLKKGERKTIIFQTDVKRKAASAESASKSAKVQDTRPRGFKRGLCAEKIVGATNDPGSLHFLMKWRGSEEMDLIPAEELNAKLPQVVIRFYEERINMKD